MNKATLWIGGATLGIVLVAAGGATAYAIHYEDKALPGVSVMGETVTGMSRSEVEALVAEKASAAGVAVQVGDEVTTVPLADLGYKVDPAATVASAFEPNSSFLGKLGALTSASDVDVQYAVDTTTFNEFVAELEESHVKPVQEASISLPEGASAYEVTESAAGAELDVSGLKTAAQEAAEKLTPTSAKLPIKPLEPEFTTEQANAIAEEANAFIAREVSITDGIDLHEPTAYEKAMWLDVSQSGVSINEENVRAWVNVAGDASNVDPSAGVRNVNERGDVVSVVQEGKSGWKANNVPEVADELLSALKAGEGFVGDFDFDEIKSDKWEDRTIAAGAESLAYQAAPGEKWIDINLSNFTVSAYEGATIVRGPVSMVPGAPATPTVEGTYKIYLKLPTQTMRGLNADGTKYETPDVPWVGYFHEGYALHGAYWRSEFGYGGPGGSHGCVNMPVDEAKWFYDWMEMGTTVVSHS